MRKWPSEVEAAYASDVDRMHRWYAFRAKQEEKAIEKAKREAGKGGRR